MHRLTQAEYAAIMRGVREGGLAGCSKRAGLLADDAELRVFRNASIHLLSLVDWSDPRLRASNEHIFIVRVLRAEEPGT